MKRRQFVIAFLSLLLLAVLSIIAVALYWYSNMSRVVRTQISIAETAIAKHQKSVLDDVERLPQSLAFPSAKTSNAGEFLHSRLPWAGSPRAIQAWKQLDRTEEIKLPASVIEKLSVARNLFALQTDSEIARVDSQWLLSLKEYSHWNLETQSPLEHTALYDLWNRPYPQFSLLVHWAQIHLLKAHSRADVRFFREVRQLAFLLQSTETVPGTMAAAQVLHWERLTWERLPKVNEDGWSVLSEVQIQAIKRSVFGLQGLWNLLQRSSSEMLSPRWKSWGVCAALNETLTLALFVKPYLHAAYAERYVAYDSLLKNSEHTCRLSLVREAWRAQIKAPHVFLPEGDPCQVAALGEREQQRLMSECRSNWLTKMIPPLRTRSGEMLVILGLMDPFRLYQDSP